MRNLIVVKDEQDVECDYIGPLPDPKIPKPDYSLNITNFFPFVGGGQLDECFLLKASGIYTVNIKLGLDFNVEPKPIN
jgi:hypothetical protein